MPHTLEISEQEIKTLASQFLTRGNIQISLNLTRGTPQSEIQINETALEQFLEISKQLQEKTGSAPITVEGLLSLKGVVEAKEAEDDDDWQAALKAALLKSLEQALMALAEARKEEGARLHDLILDQLAKIENLTEQARDCPARTPDAIRARLEAQVARIFESANSLEPDRLHQEAMLIAAKADIQEELDRLFAHVEAGRDLANSDIAVGRKFDFLAQEFNREANTLCSKSQDQEITAIGLELKTVIDQLKEQVQNVE